MNGRAEISLKRIAELAGVSVATVSRVIHKNGRYSKETEERVRAVIEEYSYTPDIAAQSMRTKRVPAIGILYPDLSNQHYSRIVMLIEEKLFDLGYTTFICGTRGDGEREAAYIRQLRQHKVSGLIFLFGAFTDNLSETAGLPKVYIGRTPDYLHESERMCVVIESDHERAGYLACSHLLRSGCSHPLIARPRNIKTALMRGRAQGFAAALAQKGMQMGEQYELLADNLSMESGYVTTKQCLASGRAFDGIYANNDRFAVGCVRALTEAGVRIPEQVKIMGHDDSAWAIYNALAITSMRDPIEEYSRIAVEELIRMMDGMAPERAQYVLPTQVVRRETT